MFHLIITDHANRRLIERAAFISADRYMSIATEAFNLRYCRPVSNKALCMYLEHLESNAHPGERHFASVWGEYIFIFSKSKNKNDRRIFLNTVYRINKQTVLNCVIYNTLISSKY